MVPERERVFIIGVGCTAFTKVQSLYANKIPHRPIPIAKGQTTDQRSMYDTRPSEFHGRFNHPHRWAWKLQPRRSLTQVRSPEFLCPLNSIAHASGITYDAIEAAFVGYVYGASTCGQAALYQLGLTGIPITNVNNNCATGSAALFHAATLVRGGEARCALALGFERMAPGALGDHWPDRPNPIRPLLEAAERASPDADRGMPAMPRIFGAAAAEYFRTYGGGVECLAKIGERLEFESGLGVDRDAVTAL